MRTTRIRTTRRAANVAGDVLLVVWIILWFLAARSLREAAGSLSQSLERLGNATGTAADRINEASRSLGEVPLVGEQLAAPFPGIAASLQNLADQITTQVASLGFSSQWLVPLVFLVPTVVAALWYIPWRIRRVQETAAARGLLLRNPSLDLFALRAVTTAHLRGVARISSDPAAAWRAQDPVIINRLATLELRRVGVEMAPAVAGPRTPTER
ncbi:hypothetical protein [Tessaracoccus antarcticus]|uniref:Uncharacterized protein n=1 Tax=Tessaracoccus antarcticus TaxID=2479848 RepID=A0A3M0GB92_9ACTN|nr:hypothetical protein [Tessaracoccus antarcticus]RMB61587.1 hypothetical protein EAX62_02840 [Tessaracoccus antarcticus]